MMKNVVQDCAELWTKRIAQHAYVWKQEECWKEPPLPAAQREGYQTPSEDGDLLKDKKKLHALG